MQQYDPFENKNLTPVPSTEIKTSEKKSLAQAVVSKETVKTKLTSKDIDDAISEIEIATHKSKSGKILRWAVIIMKDGFVVTGDPSIAVDPANDDEVKGIEIAVKNAKDKMWQFLGYKLHLQLKS